MLKLALLSLLPLALAAPTVKRDQPAPILRTRNAELIDGKYIVKMKEGMSTATLETALDVVPGSEVDHVYNTPGFRGFAISLDAKGLEALQNHPDVRNDETIAQKATN